MKLSPKKLQAALDALASAHRRANAARDKIYAHCETVYGKTPADADNDEFIDAVDGGCGNPCGMTVEVFERSMRTSIARRPS